MDFGLRDKVVAVTGGASGIGRATVEAFVREGARVTALDRDAAGLERLTEGLDGVDTGHVDVAETAAVEAAFDAIVAREGRLDVAVNNAGVISGLGWLHELDESDWDAVLGVNLKGVWLCMRAELRHMHARGAGAIVNTASTVGIVGGPGAAHYTASKWGVIGLTKTAALEYASLGIRINAVAPGTVETPMGDGFAIARRADPFPDALVRRPHPLQDAARPDQIADAIVYLAGDRSSFATGSTLVVDGGFTAQ